MLTGHDIVCISSIDWDVIWQGHQEIMSTFAKQGTRVLSALFLRLGAAALAGRRLERCSDARGTHAGVWRVLGGPLRNAIR